MKDEIQYIVSGTSQVKHHHLIQAACSYLKRSQASGTMAENQQQNKDQETKRLINFADQNNRFRNNKNHDYTNNSLALIRRVNGQLLKFFFQSTHQQPYTLLRIVIE